MAASAKMSFNYFQNGKYGTLPQNPTKDMEITQDMHLKMSKKIAQLTKVIYALNTKNDEHESIVQALKEQHEEEMQSLLTETKQKIGTYKEKLDAESVHQKKIDSLESTLSAHERHRTTAVRQFESFKTEAEEREMRLKTEHSQKMLALSQDVLQAKRDFEDKLDQFEKWKEGLNEERERDLQKLREAHAKEIDEVRNYQKSQNNEWLNSVSEVEEKYKKELEKLNDKCDSITEEKHKLAEDYEAKLAKAQLFYEKELEAVKSFSSVSQDEAHRLLQEERDRMRKEFGAQESELRKQLKSVIDQLSEREDETEKYKRELEELMNSLKDKDSSTSSLSKQIQEAKQETINALTQLKQAEHDLYGMKERCARQEEELVKKSKQIGLLEATKHQNESLIADLQAEINKLKDKLAWLDKERNNLEKQKSSLTAEQSSQLKSLEAALEDLSIEKQTMKERYQKELDSLRNKSSQSQEELLDSHKAEISKVRKDGEEELANQRRAAAETLEKAKQDLLAKHNEEMKKLIEERDNLKVEFERVRSELSSRLQRAEEEVARLDKIVRDSEQGLGSATGTINNLKEANNRLRDELEKTRANYKQEKARAANLQAELDKLKLVHDSKMKEASVELKTKLEKLTVDLETKWSETLRLECKKLRDEITVQKDSEMRAALQQLAKLKDDEIAATREGWEAKVQDLMKQIATLRSQLLNTESKTQEELDVLRAVTEAEKKKLEQELLRAADEYLAKIQALEVMHDETVSRLKEEKDHEKEELLKELQNKHIEDMKVQMTAHKATIESVKDQAETHRQTDLQAQLNQHNQTVEELRSVLNLTHHTELEKRKKDYEAHLNAARMELDRAVEISKQKERDHSMRVEELQNEITQRERHIINLKEDTTTLQTSINHLNKEIDFKRQEMQKIKADAQNQIRIKEEQMIKKMEAALDNLQADHLRESQELVNQFNEAQELLKDKISELQILLEEAEDRYRSRDSRPEDLELIQQLREAVQEREQRMKALIDEKKYYQMELVNRETNFNKVFNTTPNVGVLNPLAFKKRKGAKGPVKLSSAPSMSGRLDPLPNSPTHYNQLNPAKPLPNFPKKFLS